MLVPKIQEKNNQKRSSETSQILQEMHILWEKQIDAEKQRTLLAITLALNVFCIDHSKDEIHHIKFYGLHNLDNCRKMREERLFLRVIVI